MNPDPTPPPLLDVSEANKRYSGVPVLIDAHIRLHAGEVHALMGENGAGKSTLIKLLAGVVPPDSIRIQRRGVPAYIASPQAAHELGLRFIHQELNIVPQLSVAENVFMGQSYPTRAGLLIDWRRLEERARQVLALLDIHHINPRRQMARLSPGDQMLVSIARAFASDDLETVGSLIYVMDEPTAALTGEETAKLFRVIDRLREQDCAVLYVSHRLDEIFAIADRVTVLRDGRVVDCRPIREVTPADLIRSMTGRAMQAVYPPRVAPPDPSAPVVLEVQGLATPAVRGVSFSLRAGEIVGIAGLSGSGRTEVLRALMGVDQRLSGWIALGGRRVGRLSPTAAWRQGVAYVPEERRTQGLVMTRSIANNVSLPHLARFSRGGAFLAHSDEYRASADLGRRVQLRARGPRQNVRQLSGGNQQKVVFARALVSQPRLLLLDEPTRGVDVGAKADLYQLIREISAQGTAILMVSSDLPELIGMADRILVMRRGALALEVVADGLTEESLLALCYGEIEHERTQSN